MLTAKRTTRKPTNGWERRWLGRKLSANIKTRKLTLWAWASAELFQGAKHLGEFEIHGPGTNESAETENKIAKSVNILISF